MKLLSPDFNDGEFLEKKYSLSNDYGFGCTGKNIRPHLKWEGFSENGGGISELTLSFQDRSLDLVSSRQTFLCVVLQWGSDARVLF